MSHDKRLMPRRLLNSPAWIDVGNDASLQRCTVVDLSDSGARLAVDDIECLPDRFLLALSRFDQPRQNCYIVWRRHDEIGIEFIAATGAADDGNETLEPNTGYPARSSWDDGVSARFLRKVSAVLSHGLRRG
jgi:hypothetical protein